MPTKKASSLVAAAGNESTSAPVYPAALNSSVMGIASTTDYDTRSTFSNYGNTDVWIAAPGEYVISTFPGGTYAASSGTSFSSPLVAGSADLLLSAKPSLNQKSAASAFSHAIQLTPDLHHGRLDVYQAVSAWVNSSRRVKLVRDVADQMIPVLNMSSSLPWAPESIRLKQVEEQVSALRTSVICAFNQLLDLKDLNTGVHSTRLAEWGMRVGQELGLDESELQNLEVVALLHDIGKVGVPDSILKKPGKVGRGRIRLNEPASRVRLGRSAHAPRIRTRRSRNSPPPRIL